MCDTLGKILPTGTALFAKNSDRSPNEPQVAEFRAARENAKKTLQATYIEIPEVAYCHATLLSRPVWMWGAEMGVNGQGVCIGNEAVFTKGPYQKTGLTGMDLVRLGLERGSTAKQALEVILDLLARYGQGGNCGYDHSFAYDNAFLIMDRQAVYILETAGKKWAYKQVAQGSISNRLALGRDADAYSGGVPCDFAGIHLEPVFSFFSGSEKRLRLTAGCLAGGGDAAGMMAALRTHRRPEQSPLAHADVASPCMHAGGLVGDHTTASMVVELGQETVVWLTGSSTPCISLFKPWGFGNRLESPVFEAGQAPQADAYWRAREGFVRKAMGHRLPTEFYRQRDALEAEWLEAARQASLTQLAAVSEKAARQEQAFYDHWSQVHFGPMEGSAGFRRYWRKKTEALKTPARPVVEAD